MHSAHTPGQQLKNTFLEVSHYSMNFLTILYDITIRVF